MTIIPGEGKEIKTPAFLREQMNRNQGMVRQSSPPSLGKASKLPATQNLTDQTTVCEHEGGRLEPERTKFLLDGGRDLRMFAEPEDAPTRGA
jgi:hypothetical protein